MKTIPVEVREGVLRLAGDFHLPPNAHLAVLALEENENFSGPPPTDLGAFFAFLTEEPELYSDVDVIPGRRNPGFKGSA